ncbi:hypothetical protein SUGI_0327340 [Cryptomeria japonica]|uniref:glucan endo-1,3-beta-glucosidase-like n=1 Tax=Cryptomeria japonica TaxID=3369 RepID=UPI002408E2C4|nr:glucan endo-1,3-beta-glucosidase-like [Cryptomeria japonica]GLJ18459.1 hypothetical protein SUGI_0327340 [Cryptomeria japonica]
MAARVGVCYGMLGNLPSPREVVELLKRHNIGKVRIFEAHHEALRALENTGIEVIVGLRNEELEKIAGNQAAANGWVKDNVGAFYPAANIKYISVGNEVLHYGNEKYVSYLVPAIRNIQTAVRNANLHKDIRVSTTHASSVLGNSYPPSQGEFRNDLKSTLRPLLNLLAENGSPFMANVYPYFSYAGNKAHISLDYALFKPSAPVVHDEGREYRNLFDAMVDALIAACERAGHPDLPLLVTESGWPSAGDDHDYEARAVTVDNAKVYNNNLIRHVSSNQGTPRRPGKPIHTYVFSLFNENLKPGPEIERHFGLFYPNKNPVYPVNFTPY